MIQVKNIVKDYVAGDTTVHALKDVSINFKNSEFVSILGPSGCGKTTLLNIIGGLDKYTSGDIIINGVSTKEYKDKDWDAYRNHYIGFVFQSYNLIGHLSILENVELALSVAGISKKEKRKKALKALKEVGLESQVKKKPNQLSGGQMQRVAIARAIVNEPKIILADEPTGALDSETSVQVMDILKKISDKYLIIMVTHNEDLASIYSSRIISILDGELKSDTNPYTPSQDEIESDKKEYEKKDNKDKKKIAKNKLKTSMSYGTAFNLSLKNLWSKKGKTIIESLAGSIGIIGIALVLAVSSGFTNYINNLQTNTLGGYPLTLSMVSMDMDKLTGGLDLSDATEKVESEDSLGVYDQMAMFTKLGHLNIFSEEFIEYVDKYVEEDKEKGTNKVKNLQYGYNLPLTILKQTDGVVGVMKNDSSTSVLSGSSNSSVYEIIDNKEWVLDNYEIIGEYASNPNELMLVIGDDNKFDISVVKNYGFGYEVDEDGSYKDIKYSDIINNTKYTLVLNNSYYIKNGEKFEINDFKNEDKNKEIYEKGEDFIDFEIKTDSLLNLNITGILKPKENIEMEILKTGLVYLSSFREMYNENALNSDIVKFAESKIEDNVNNGILSDERYKIDLPWDYVVIISEMAMVGMNPSYINKSTTALKQYTKNMLNKDISYEMAYNMALQSVGVTKVPSSILLSPTSFDAKQDFINYIASWNQTEDGKTNKIIYTDATSMLTNTMGQMIDIISYVLIAFAGISLVVSSVMIGIITYTSVIERTKEIGILRSIGARKKDISRIFNSETILVGFFSGLLGVFISWLLTFPISAIIKAVAGGAITTSMAILEFGDALILIIISTLLTTIAGTVPARIASKKDPVRCLRSE